MERTKEEYGGYLPLELPVEKEHLYSSYSNVLRFNTIKAAIPLIQKKLKVDEIYVPYYLCPNVIAELEKSFSKVIFYNINEELLPIINDTFGKVIYLVNYFGVMDKRIKKYIGVNNKAKFLLDNAHSFFCEPIISNNVFNLYSCKKFFGVPDGGFLISKEYVGNQLPFVYSSSYSNYLIKSLEQGTNSCYAEKKAVDEQINSTYSGISVFALKILNSLNYKNVKNQRKENFKIYDKAFSKINKIKCENGSVPYLYPLNIGINIKKELVNQKIYVPTLWSQCLDSKNEFEKKMADETIFLPIDQRYNRKDIEYIVTIINQIIDERRG